MHRADQKDDLPEDTGRVIRYVRRLSADRISKTNHVLCLIIRRTTSLGRAYWLAHWLIGSPCGNVGARVFLAGAHQPFATVPHDDGSLY